MYHETFGCAPRGFHNGLLLESDRTNDRETADAESERTDDSTLEVSV
ncbi:hypothetical protein [Natronococcus occultus]|uniref:Uncharacterized protein n=1 Tax=Natronococcus occultus SP4 TaxID=694430 RepID=L0K541_9EURY|nr:hypothetical protein [Natronococcus occultus]AGB39484.1 hypothetical protein Natoc_3772 [Natronococcus occultus SP4]